MMIDLALLNYVVVMSITPGPNNMMLAASGVNFGLRRTLPHMLGVNLGCGLQCLCITVTMSVLTQYLTQIRLPLAIVGCLYLFWFSWRLWQAGSPVGRERAVPMTLLGAMLFQWVNPKSWLMMVNTAILFTPRDLNLWLGAIWLGLYYVIFGFPCTSTWAVVGDRLGKLLQIPWRLRLFNGVMAVSLMLTACWILLDEWQGFQQAVSLVRLWTERMY
ncbi:MAG: LysE family translocator [Enterobacteriaceae bacterium]